MLSVVVTEVYSDYILVVEASDINHIKNVFRKVKGDKIRAVDGTNEYLCEIEKIEDSFSLDIEVDAGISILKGDKMDLTIQKLTELGINKIIPISVKRCVVKLNKKKDRWNTISKEALKQCQGVVPTVIDEIKKIDKLNFKDYDLILVPYENEKEIFIKDILRNLKVKPTKILYIIGAEGGFEKEEIDYLREKGAKIISLGKRILRAETAAIVTGGVIINEFF